MQLQKNFVDISNGLTKIVQQDLRQRVVDLPLWLAPEAIKRFWCVCVRSCVCIHFLLMCKLYRHSKQLSERDLLTVFPTFYTQNEENATRRKSMCTRTPSFCGRYLHKHTLTHIHTHAHTFFSNYIHLYASCMCWQLVTREHPFNEFPFSRWLFQLEDAIMAGVYMYEWGDRVVRSCFDSVRVHAMHTVACVFLLRAPLWIALPSPAT